MKRAKILNGPVWRKCPVKFFSRSTILPLTRERSLRIESFAALHALVAVTSANWSFFSIRDFTIQPRGRQRERKKNNRFYKQNNYFARSSHLLYISFPVFARLRREMPNFAFSGERKQATTKFEFLFLNLDMVPRNSPPGGFTYIWQSNWVGIIAIKTATLHSTVWTPGKGYGPPKKLLGVKDALLPLQTTSTGENKLNCVYQVCNKLAREIAYEIGVTTAILICTREWKIPTNWTKGWRFFFACVMSVKDQEANDLFFPSLTQQHLAGIFPGHFSKNQRLQVLNFSRQISSEYDELRPNDFERQAILQTLVVLWNDKEMIRIIIIIIIIVIIIGSLGKDVYERCTSTGRHHCTFCN